MGNSGGAGCSSSSSPTHSYSFLQQLTPHTQLLLNQQQQQILSHQRTFPSQDILRQQLHPPYPTHPNYLTPIHTEVVAVSHLCGKQYKIIQYYPYIPHSLLDEITQRAQANRPFSPPELISILCSCVLAMAHLTKQEAPHYTLAPDDLLIDSQGRIKIKHSSLSAHKFDFNYQPQYYYAPETLKMLKQPVIPNGLTHKSAVFTLRVTLLHATSLTPQHQLYDHASLTLNPQPLSLALQQIQDPQLTCILDKMLRVPSYERITFPELQEMLYAMVGEEQSPYSTKENENISKLEDSISKIRKREEQSHLMSSSCSALQPLLDQAYLQTDFYLRPTHYTAPLQEDQEDIPQETIQHILTTSTDSLTLDEYDNSMPEWSSLNSPCPPQNSRNTPEMCTPLSQNTNILNLPSSSSFSKKGEQRVYVVEEEREGRYEGYKINNLKHGFGSYYYRQGGKYCGEWIRGEMTGRGVLYYSSGKIAYQGEWRSNRLDGYGLLYNENIQVFEGESDYRHLDHIVNEWIKYQGYFRGDVKEGQGTLYLSNGETYCGCFHQDQAHGPGQFRNVRGEVVRGCWDTGKLNCCS